MTVLALSAQDTRRFRGRVRVDEPRETANVAVFEDGLEELGFVLGGSSRRGGRMWRLQFNRHLEFVLHDYDDAVLLSWSFGLGEFAAERGWVLGTGELSFHDLYPKRDVRLAIEIGAVEAEIRRTLLSLRLDLGTPNL